MYFVLDTNLFILNMMRKKNHILKKRVLLGEIFSIYLYKGLIDLVRAWTTIFAENVFGKIFSHLIICDIMLFFYSTFIFII